MNSAQNLPSFPPSANEVLADQISELAAHIHAATYRFLVLIREFDEREAWAEMGARSCAHWLNWRCGISVRTAREKLRVAHALQGLEKISASFARGELSYSKIRAVTRIANKNNEDTLLNIALSGSASQLERVVRCEIRCDREEEIKKRTEAAFEGREFGWRNDADGSVVFFGRLPAELAGHVVNAVEASLPKPDDDAANVLQGNEPSARVLETGHDVRENLTKNGSAEPRDDKKASKTLSLAARRADALVALCTTGCEGYEVTLHVPAGTSMHANILEGAGTIPMEAAKRICCDASMVPVTEDEQGHVLDIGRRTRKIPPAIRRALEVRDKGCCRFPGCTSTHFLKGHHIEHWANGGKTCLDNLVLLCWHHHHLVHEGGFSCRAVRRKNGPGINIVFGTPGGVMIPDAFCLTPADGVLEDRHARIAIDEETCTARDGNRPLDVNVVIDALNWFKKR